MGKGIQEIISGDDIIVPLKWTEYGFGYIVIRSPYIAGRIVLSHVHVSRFAEDVEYSEAHFHWPG